MNIKLPTLGRLSIALAIAAAISVTGCSSKKTKPEEPTTPAVATEGDETGPLGDSDSGKAMGLKTVHFPYDSFVLDSEAKGALKENAAIMKDKTNLKVQVEGHCDQRGGIQYNIALGEKRANAVKKYLEDLGVAGGRISTISFGKERPIDPSENEAAYSKNRRANFVITSH